MGSVGLNRYRTLIVGMGVVFLGLFALVEALDIEILTDPGPWLALGGPLAATVGFVLLVTDVLLPVPASLVMIAHGALFGVVPGALLSLTGGVAASAVGFALGRWGRAGLARWVPPDERERAESLLSDWGDLAVLVTRPVPILAESVAILAGTSNLGWGRFLLASAAGVLPAAAIYAVGGHFAVDLEGSFLVFAAVLALAGLFWLFGRRFRAGRQRVRP